MPRTCWWSVLLLFAICFFLGCTAPLEERVAPPEESPAYEYDPISSEDLEDPIRRECRASLDDDPRSETLTQEQFDALLNRCVDQTERLAASLPK